jgi:hypothetical protein
MGSTMDTNKYSSKSSKSGKKKSRSPEPVKWKRSKSPSKSNDF